jgi:hypothetical protein
MTVTQNTIDRLQRDWTTYAGEPMRVEYVKGTFYGFASELATLRLFRKYAPNPNARQNYSDNMAAFYFSLDTSL